MGPLYFRRTRITNLSHRGRFTDAAGIYKRVEGADRGFATDIPNRDGDPTTRDREFTTNGELSADNLSGQGANHENQMIGEHRNRRKGTQKNTPKASETL